MIYPAMILGVTVQAVAILLAFVIPTFGTIFASVGAPLPLPTRLVINASGLVQGCWWALAAAA